MSEHLRHSAVVPLIALMVATFGVETTAHAQWTLPRGDLAIVVGYDYQFATQEYRDRGERRTNFPLNGRYSASNLTIGARAGITDALEFELIVPVKLVSFTADPVILLEPGMGAGGIDFFQENIIDLSQTQRGLGDIYLSARYSLLRSSVAIAAEWRLKAPTGYQAPQGTFGADPRDRETFVENVGSVVDPSNVQDDVTLGDGQVDLQTSLLFGAAFPTRTFLRGDVGYNARLGGAGHQVVGSLKLGQFISSRLLLYVEGRIAYTVTEGDVYGVSVAAEDPDLPAVEYQGLNNLLLREVRLERDVINISAGAIVRVTDEVEINAGFARTLWGRNTAVITTLFLSAGVRTTLLDPPADVVEDDYEEEPAYDEGSAELEEQSPEEPTIASEPSEIQAVESAGSSSVEPTSAEPAAGEGAPLPYPAPAAEPSTEQ